MVVSASVSRSAGLALVRSPGSPRDRAPPRCRQTHRRSTPGLCTTCHLGHYGRVSHIDRPGPGHQTAHRASTSPYTVAPIALPGGIQENEPHWLVISPQARQANVEVVADRPRTTHHPSIRTSILTNEVRRRERIVQVAVVDSCIAKGGYHIVILAIHVLQWCSIVGEVDYEDSLLRYGRAGPGDRACGSPECPEGTRSFGCCGEFARAETRRGNAVRSADGVRGVGTWHLETDRGCR